MVQAVHWLGEIEAEDRHDVGEKAAKLGELLRNGSTLPEGFVVPASVYFRFLKQHALTTKITHLLDTITYTDPASLLQVSSHIRKLIVAAPLPESEQKEIFTAYRRLSGPIANSIVVVRPSPISDDLHRMVFSGHPKTFLHVEGEANVLMKIKETWASLFDPRAIFYRHEKRVDHFRLGMGVIVQTMIQAEALGSMMTVDPETNDPSRIAIFHFANEQDASYDDYRIDKKSGETSFKHASDSTTKPTPLTRDQLASLLALGQKIEAHTYYPQVISWVIRNSVIYVLQADNFTPYVPEEKPVPLALGNPGAPGIAYGKLALMLTSHEKSTLQRGDIAVVTDLSEKQLPELKKASGIIVEKKTSPAIITKAMLKLGVPIVTGVTNAAKTLKSQAIVSLDGKKGAIYSGSPLTPVAFASRQSLTTATRLYVTAQGQENTTTLATLPTDGIGMLDGGRLITEIGIHPKKVLREGNRREYEAILAEKIAKVAHPFQPRPVFYRFSDLTSTAYKKLSAGKTYEPDEVNPLLGYHGAFRFIHDPQLFTLEIESIKLLRQKYELRNISLIIPSVRSVKELATIKKLLAKYGLMRSYTNKLFLEVSIPANVIMLEDYINVGIDGLVINADQLSSFILGVDPENSEVIHEFEEQHPAILQAYYHIIKSAKNHGLSSSIFGQAPSLYPELVDKLVDWGISGISVTPYALENTRKTIYNYERKLIS